MPQARGPGLGFFCEKNLFGERYFGRICPNPVRSVHYVLCNFAEKSIIEHEKDCNRPAPKVF